MVLTGRTALITGASSGLGAAFAEELGRRKVNLVLVARSEQVLMVTAGRLHREYGVRTDVIVQGLALEGAATAVCHRIDELGVRVNLLINNAGFATQGRFETIPAGQDHREVMLNVATVVNLIHALLPNMLADGTGGIINVASLGGFQPAHYLAVYGATKAFVLSFSQALSAELRGRGVTVLALCPGPVDTRFFDVLGSRAAAIGQQLDAATIITEALEALAGGAAVLVPGWRNRLMAHAVRLLPLRVVLAAAERSTRRVIIDPLKIG